MISKTLVKLVDEAILPAVVLVSAKLLSGILVTEALGLKWTWQDFGMSFHSPGDFLKDNSYSALVMFGIILVFTIWVLFKSHVFHDSHISPSVSVKVLSLNLPRLIQSSFELYSQATVWLSYSWLTTAMLGVSAFSNLIYPWVFYVALGLSLLTSVAMIIDIEREVVINHEDFLEPSNSYA